MMVLRGLPTVLALMLATATVLSGCSSRGPLFDRHTTAFKESIHKTVTENTGPVKSCYVAVLKRRPDLVGKLVVEWVISEFGDVQKARIEKDKSTIQDPAFESCLLTASEKWKFPASKYDFFTVSYPFEFSNQGTSL